MLKISVWKVWEHDCDCHHLVPSSLGQWCHKHGQTIWQKCQSNTLHASFFTTQCNTALLPNVSTTDPFCLSRCHFYLTSGVVGYMAVIFSARLVAMKCEVFATASTGEIELCIRPATQLTRCPPLLPANRVCQSIACAWRFQWKGRSVALGSKPITHWRQS